jgi:preprotein translocase subunit SecD
VDSNLAMVLAMFILYSFGTVQVKGFAVTLIAGIIAALVTSLFFTRFILETFATDLDKMKKNILGV